MRLGLRGVLPRYERFRKPVVGQVTPTISPSAGSQGHAVTSDSPSGLCGPTWPCEGALSVRLLTATEISGRTGWTEAGFVYTHPKGTGPCCLDGPSAGRCRP